jgi:hypothetical protein
MQATTKQQISLVATGSAVVLGGTGFAQSDPNLGTWTLNLAKSKYDPGPPPISETVVIEAWETDGIKETFTITQADGTHAEAEVSYHCDGKDYKVTDGDTIVHRRLDADTITYTIRRAGRSMERGKLSCPRMERCGR